MQERVRETEQAEPSEPIAAEPQAPHADDLALASAVGNRAMAMAVTARRPVPGQRRVARQDVPPAPVTLNAPAEPEKAEFKEADKERARKTVIAPLRSGAEQLGAGPKANMGSVVRHIRPVYTAVMGIKWQPVDAQLQSLEAVQELPAIADLLESLKLSDRQAVTKVRSHWAAAKRNLAKAETEIQKANIPDKKHPDRQVREGAPEDMIALVALKDQVDATIKDLAEAPRTQEGYKDVEKTAVDILGQFDTIHPLDDMGLTMVAKSDFLEGIGTLAPLALGKEEAVTQARAELLTMANTLATLVGDAPAEEPKADDDPDPSADPAPPPPAPSVNPLPPPPPPPVQGPTPAPANAPAPAGTH